VVETRNTKKILLENLNATDHLGDHEAYEMILKRILEKRAVKT
jgi:hypothetical protein